jgi:hypothetical protein
VSVALNSIVTIGISGVANVSSFGPAGLTTNKYLMYSVQTGISAAGTTQGAATQLGNIINIVSTVSGGANGVVLPSATAGMILYITNSSANALNVFPASGAAINTGATNAALSQAAGATLQFIAPTTTQWYSVGATYA